MTSATLHKSLDIYRSGGVERTGPTSYRVHSTSGEHYAVWVAPELCTCPTPKHLTCSHVSAVNIHRAKRK